MNNKDKKRYILTLPERSVRATTAFATSLTSLISKHVFPKAIRHSATYKVTFGMLQQFLIQKVAEIELEEKDFKVGDDYLVRKTAGTLIEGIGLVSVRFSPVWMLAILSDVTGGSKTYFEMLLDSLKKAGLVEESHNYEHVFDLLEGLQKGTRIGVDAIDMPPLSAEDFKAFKDSVGTNMKQNMNHTRKLYSDMEKVFGQMLKVNQTENVPIEKLSGAMSIDLMKRLAKKGLDITTVTTASSFKLITNIMLDSFQDSLNEVSKEGAITYLGKHMSPFMKQIKVHFDPHKETTTDRVLNRLFRRK